MVRQAHPHTAERTQETSTATSSDIVKELDPSDAFITTEKRSYTSNEKGSNSSPGHAERQESTPEYDHSAAHSEDEYSGSSPNAKALSNCSMNEEDGGADWSPEIPFRDLNDLVRLSVDEDCDISKQKGKKERDAQDSRREDEGMEVRQQGCQPTSQQNMLHTGSRQTNLIASEKTSLLAGNTGAFPTEDPTSIPAVLTMAEQVDMILDQYIEIESNKRMMQENVTWFCLTFKLKPMESKFHQVKDMVFKSNALCVCIAWFFLSSSQLLILPMYVPT